MSDHQGLQIDYFKAYYEANVSALIMFSQRFVPFDIAGDIVHDVFLEVWNSLEVYKEMPSKSYLFMAVRNRCLNFLKREKVKDHYINTAQLDNRILGLDHYESYEKLITEKEDMQVIYDQIEQLPEKCRIVFKMSYFEDKKNAEIAEILNISIRTVEHQLYLGLKMLRERLTAKGKKRLFFMLFL